MHGKIVQYSHSTGLGIIINAHKKLFDFKLSSWHDNTKIPEINLLVEFRLEDETHNIIDVRSSKYQEFDDDSIIKERDFWKTATDDELEVVETGVFDELIQKTYKSTDYVNLAKLQTSIDIDKFIQYHFENETKIVRYASKLPIDGYEKLDYRIVNRFLKRTLDTLIYTDKRITKDTFSNYLQVFSKLQYFVTPFYKSQQEAKKVFRESFLPQQLYFSAARQKLESLKDDVLRIENKKRNIKGEIYTINIKLSGQDTRKSQLLKDRIEKLNAQHKECLESETKLVQLKEHIEGLLAAFVREYEKPFMRLFDKMRDQIFEQIKDAMNITITSLDNKIWQLGMASEPIKIHFFKLQTNSAFCTMAFMQQYIKTLDSSKLSDNDKLLNLYINRYKERNTKKILLVSSDEELKTKLKLKILKMQKNYIVTTIEKKMEYTIIIANQKFDFVIIDLNTKEEKPVEMVVVGKNTKLNKDASFIVYSEGV